MGKESVENRDFSKFLDKWADGNTGKIPRQT